jgi:DNA polymerase III delta subunit
MDNAAPVLMFYGDPYRCDRALIERERALRDREKDLEREARFADEVDVASFDTELLSAPLFALGRHFVVRGVERARKPKPWADLASRALPQGTYVTFLGGADVKSAHPLVAACAAHGNAVPLPAPPVRSAAQSARAILSEFGLRPSGAVVENLVARVGGDLLALDSEARKLRAFSRGEALTPEAVASLAFPGAEATVYPFYDRLGERDLAGALRSLADVREDAGRILSGAVRHLVRVAVVRALLARGVSDRAMEDLASMPGWLLRRVVAQAKRFTLEEATAALSLGVRLDAATKGGSRSAGDALLELIFSVTSSPRPSAPARTARTLPAPREAGSG